MRQDGWRGTAALAVSASLFLAGSAAAVFTGTPIETARAEAMEVRTWQGIPWEGTFPSDGKDGAFTVAERPRMGVVSVDGDRFTYTPGAGSTGVDRFTYTVTDQNGNVTLPGTVTVFVGRGQVRYEDLDGEASAWAAQDLAEAGVFIGEKIGERYYFRPGEGMSRQEFLAAAMEALGKEAVPDGTTGFCDDEAIPAWARSYAAGGAAEGIVRGIGTASGTAFLGGDPVTWGQAAAIVSRALGLEDVDMDEWYGLREEVTSWAAQELADLEAAGIVPAGSFGSLTMEEALTRSDAAGLLSAARRAMTDAEEAGILDHLRALMG